MMRPRAPKITVRRGSVDDAEAIRAIFAMPRAMAGTLQLPYPTAEMWAKRIAENANDDYMLVAEVDGRVVGNLGLHPASRSPRRRHAASIGISVRDDWQRRGIGSALMAAALDVADNWLNYRRLELTVYADNAAAVALYRKFGFAVEGTHRDYAFRDGRFVDAYAMARVHPAAARAGATGTKGAPASGTRGAAHRKATKTARKPKSA
ncbi:MAG: GNAT family N-acetyltransferase [Burkholderiales bacterium]